MQKNMKLFYGNPQITRPDLRFASRKTAKQHKTGPEHPTKTTQILFFSSNAFMASARSSNTFNCMLQTRVNWLINAYMAACRLRASKVIWYRTCHFLWSAPVAFFRRVALETPEWTSRDSNHTGSLSALARPTPYQLSHRVA